MTDARKTLTPLSLLAWPLAIAAAVVLTNPAAARNAKTRSAQAQAAAPGGAQPALLGQYGEWGAYTGTSNGKKVCFALARPTSSETNPPNRPRDPIYLFVSTRPAENVHNEVSVIIGYPFKENSDAVIEVDSAKFEMYTQSDGAWIKNAADEARLVEAMRKGAKLVVYGTSSRGTKTTDQFSLMGISQAMDKATSECK